MNPEIEIPTFTHGSYPALDGEVVTFTDELMRQLERNTNFVIQAGILTPPVGYDTIDENGKYAHRGTDAHGQISKVTYRNGVVSLTLAKPTQTFRDDVKEGKRLRVSGEFNPKFSYVDASGKTVTVGPTIVGLAALGRFRPALKNPKLIPLSELNFGETVGPADAFAAREELRRGGFIAHTLADNRFCFSEIDIDPERFEENKEPHMTAEEKAEMQRLLDAQATKFSEQLTAMQTATEAKIKLMSEESQKRADRVAKAKTIMAAKPMGKEAGERLEALLLDPSLDTAVAFAESIPIALITKPDTKKTKKFGEGDDDENENDEPKALAAVRVKHFADLGNSAENQAIVDAGIAAFSEAHPDKVKGKENNVGALVDLLRRHVIERDGATN